MSPLAYEPLENVGIEQLLKLMIAYLIWLNRSRSVARFLRVHVTRSRSPFINSLLKTSVALLFPLQYTSTRWFTVHMRNVGYITNAK